MACAEYGYASVKLVENLGDKGKKLGIVRISSDGGEYQIPVVSHIYLSNLNNTDLVKDRINKFLQKYNRVEIRFFEEEGYIRFFVPNSGRSNQFNPLDYVVLFLSENREFLSENIKLFEYLRRNIAFNPSGKILGINRHHNLLKNTEVILKKIKINGNTLSADIYIKFPYGIESSTLVDKIKNSVEVFNNKESSELEVYANAYNPITIDSNSEVAKRIRKAYASVVGKNDGCIISNGIYTKLFPNAIGFGPELPDLGKNNQVLISDIMKIFKIYLYSMIFLMER